MTLLTFVQSSPLPLSITSLTVGFIHKLADYLSDVTECKKRLKNYRNRRTDAVESARLEEELLAAQFKRHWIMIASGVVGIATPLITDLQSGTVGVAWGGTLSILSAMIQEWPHYNEGAKLGIFGASLVALLAGAAKLGNQGVTP